MLFTRKKFCHLNSLLPDKCKFLERSEFVKKRIFVRTDFFTEKNYKNCHITHFPTAITGVDGCRSQFTFLYSPYKPILKMGWS